MSNKDILIHIGYHKTGSTFLQDLIFLSQDCGFYSPWSPKEYSENLVVVNPFDFNKDKVRSFFEPGIQKAWLNSMTPVISYEAFSGDPWKKGCNSGFNNKAVADRLAEVFPNGKVLIVIREQASMLLSLYKHSIRSHWSMTIKDYLEQPIDYKEIFNPHPLFRLEYLDYHWLISYYQKLFGKENVLVLPYEKISMQESDFLETLSTFTGKNNIPKNLTKKTLNKSYSGFTIWLKRWANILCPTCAQPNRTIYQKINNYAFYQINKIIPKWLGKAFDKRFEEMIERQIEEHYAESNYITSQLIGIDLKAYGYKL